MALIELKGIGKIYVSEGNVSVGIRGVDLSFDRGEFVAVTGKSGSGKSTLLNVISGMDTYEEGELYVGGEPTSHYLQSDWEEYRKKYISFIFQEYNIIESFTVLQNVELALMNIEDTKERRKRALELIRRVGLEDHIRSKGSKLSGGQKQRTVIARALAKDSPIILADEPTGNLDSQTSKEIIELLREVSKDKLVIVVTHNFEQVEEYATRHIRIFDGTVESDRKLTEVEAVGGADLVPDVKPNLSSTIKNGLILGRVRFFAMPKLSVFLCLLMTLTSLVLTLIISESTVISNYLEKNYMFSRSDGRTVVIRKDEQPMTDKELDELKSKVGAESYLHYDYLLDTYAYPVLHTLDKETYYHEVFKFAVYPEKSVKLSAGKKPEKPDEIVMRVPINMKPCFIDFENGETQPLNLEGLNYTVTGVSYYYDNTVDPLIYVTEEGYRKASTIWYFERHPEIFSAQIKIGDFDSVNLNGTSFHLSDMLDTYFVSYPKISELEKEYGSEIPINVKLTAAVTFDESGFGMPADEDTSVTVSLDKYSREKNISDEYENYLKMMGVELGSYTVFAISDDVLSDFIGNDLFPKAYTQASLFFPSDKAAHSAADELRELGYVAVVSDETVEMNVLEKLLAIVTLFFEAVGWAISVVFIVLFLRLCTSKAMNATRGDIPIMRSMGIPTGVMKVGIYTQTLTTLIPAYLVTATLCFIIFVTPETNGIFTFIHPVQYAVIAVVLLAAAIRLAGRYVKKMFGESVRKTLKGGNDQ